VDKPSDVLKIGQEIEAKVVDFNPDERKISLSMKAIEQDASDDKEDETVFEDTVDTEEAPAVEEAPVDEAAATEE
jgi:ribosomal protein S1